ncbi:MAG: amidase [Vicinamibacterales bacterium]
MRNRQTIRAAAHALRHGETTSVALTEACLAAIVAHNAATNAFILVDADGAREAARAADASRARGVDRGPLDGIPLSLKDLIDVARQPTTAASRALAHRVARTDAPVTARLRAAGAVLVGKTNLHEFALGTTSEDSAWGPVRHPDDPGRSAGGSSGGSAVAVATGMSLASIGTDTGGSIRIPSAACGVVGLKPSLGEVPTEGVIPLSRTLDHVGPLAASVQDAAWVWQAITGRPFEVVEPVAAAGLTLARIGGWYDAPVAPEVRAATDAAVAALGAAGVAITRAELPGLETLRQTYVDLVLPEAAWWHAPLIEARGDDYTPRVRERIESGRAIPATRYLAALDHRAALTGIVNAALGRADALLLPTLPMVAPRLGEEMLVLDPARPEPEAVRALMLKHTQLFNITGHPAVSLPLPVAGLPIGLQIVGRRQRTRDLLAIAAACEKIVAG